MRPRNTVSLLFVACFVVNMNAHAQGLVLYHNADVITLDPSRPRAAALLVEGDRIKQVLAQVPDRVPAGARRIDLGGATVVPGLADAHLHLASIGREARALDLEGSASEAEAVSRVQAYAAKHGGDGPIVGFDWDQNLWRPSAFPTRETLDAAVGSRVVILYRVDGHAAWVSSAALTLGGLDAHRVDPPGGRIVRDSEGRATGVLLDDAIGLVSGQLPASTRTETENDLEHGARRCAELGLTSVHDMGVSKAELQALRALERRGTLPLRVFAYLDGDAARSQLRGRPRRTTGLVEVRGVKLFADGALGSRGAALKAPYSDDPGNQGILATEPKQLEERARSANERGYQVAIHAIGDRGNRLALDTIAALGPSARARRHRIEHAQIVDPVDLQTFAALGVIASMQPLHATSDMGWAEQRLGANRLAGAYAWRALSDAGAVLAFGSDAPVESAAPLWGLFAAVHRTDHNGRPAGGWTPGQKLDRQKALAAFTTGPAFAVGREDELGVLRAGALADFTSLDADPTEAKTKLLKVKVLRTVVGGRTTWPTTEAK